MSFNRQTCDFEIVCLIWFFLIGMWYNFCFASQLVIYIITNVSEILITSDFFNVNTISDSNLNFRGVISLINFNTKRLSLWSDNNCRNKLFHSSLHPSLQSLQYSTPSISFEVTALAVLKITAYPSLSSEQSWPFLRWMRHKSLFKTTWLILPWSNQGVCTWIFLPAAPQGWQLPMGSKKIRGQ